jgi:hypothetical protein
VVQRTGAIHQIMSGHRTLQQKLLSEIRANETREKAVEAARKMEKGPGNPGPLVAELEKPKLSAFSRHVGGYQNL